MPISRATCGVRWERERPWTLQAPSVHGKVPAMRLMSVDLPAPFSPSSACTSPFSSEKSTLSSATTPRNLFVIPETCSILFNAQNRRRGSLTASMEAARLGRIATDRDVETVGDGPAGPSVHLLDREFGSVSIRCKDLRGVDLVDIVLGDDARSDQQDLLVVLLLERAHGKVDADAAHDDRIFGGEAEHGAVLDRLQHGLVLIGRHDGDVAEAGVSHGADGRFGGRRAAPDDIDVRIGLQRILDKLQLGGNARLAEHFRQQLYVAGLGAVAETVHVGLGPATALRAGEGD